MAEIELAHKEVVDKLSFTDNYNTEAAQNKADYSAPSVGEDTKRMETPLPPDPFSVDNQLHTIEERLQYALSKADDFQKFVVYGETIAQERFSHAVLTFLENCQPYFNYLESTARNTSPGRPPLPLNVRNQLLQFSQQLCSRLEQMVLVFSSQGSLSLDETDPMGVSHFYIGQCQVDNIKLSIFRYCQPTPFLLLPSNRLYKRMRWNVEQKKGWGKAQAGGEEEKYKSVKEVIQQMEGEQEAEREEEIADSDCTGYYLLCYEDINLVDKELLREQTDRRTAEKAVLRMWSVGKWLRIYPDPETEDIHDWVLCKVPQGQYKPLAYLGEEEPSPRVATDCLMGVLLSQVKHSITQPVI